MLMHTISEAELNSLETQLQQARAANSKLLEALRACVDVMEDGHQSNTKALALDAIAKATQ